MGAWERRERWPLALRASAIAAAAIPVFAFGFETLRTGSLIRLEAPIHTNWATHQQYREVGLWLADHLPAGVDVKMNNGSEVGTLAYYSNRKMLEHFGNRAQLRPLIEKRTNHPNRFLRFIWRLNFRFLPSEFPARRYQFRLTFGDVDQPSVGSVPIREWWLQSKWQNRKKIELQSY